MSNRYSRMSNGEIVAIVKDLDRWAAGQLGSKLTWAILEERFGFSRQSLQDKPEIKAAYDLAKHALSGGLVKNRQEAAKDINELHREVARLKFEIIEFQKKEQLWMLRWQRIAYHIRAKGIQMSDVDKPTNVTVDFISQSELSVILKPFDEIIPPSGRV